MPVYLTATLKCKPEFLEEVKTLLLRMVSESRKEAGCIRYDLYQALHDETVFIFEETWESEEVLKQHNQQNYILEFNELIPEKLRNPPEIYWLQQLQNYRSLNQTGTVIYQSACTLPFGFVFG